MKMRRLRESSMKVASRQKTLRKMRTKLRKPIVVTLRHQNQVIKAGIKKEDAEVAHVRRVGAGQEVVNVPEEGRAKVGQEARSVRRAKSTTRVKTLKATTSNQRLCRKSSSESERERREMNTKRLQKSIHQVFVSS